MSTVDFFLIAVDKEVFAIMSEVRDVSEILKLSESQYTPDKMAYKHIIVQVDKLLRSRALEQNFDASFEVPAMVLFKPHFDRDRVTRKIVKHYTNIGFDTTSDGYSVHIRWGSKDESKQQESENEEEEFHSDSSSSDEDLPGRKIVLTK